ncbi:MAG: DUF370 domain-containing protein [Armatimonadota bacterium]|nr:DUF370 domain-containing protein [Armatimonadota bacterium]
MYVHLGGDLVVLTTEIVTILDARLLEKSEEIRCLIERAAKEGRLRGNGITAECKTLVITSSAIYPSTVSSVTLAKRIFHSLGRTRFSGAEAAKWPF